MVAIAVQGLVAVALTAFSQTPAEPNPTPTLKVNTRLTLVDVTVTDTKGHPVHGLTQADFTIKEDGKPQPIKNFEAFSGETPVEAALQPNVYSNRQTPHDQAVNILLLDQVTMGLTEDLRFRPAALKAAKEASVNFVKTMPSVTQVAVLEMDGSGLKMLQGFTSNRELLLAAINSVAYQRVPQSIWEPPQSSAVPGLPRERPNYTFLCNAMNFQSAQALNALNQMTLFVAGVAGRKNLLWFTRGVPWLVNYQPFGQSQNLSCLSDFKRQMQAVYGRLTAERVAVYPINSVGENDDNNASGGYEALEDLAKSTGGKAHYNNDLLGALQEDTASGADYYALSYIPPLEKYDGKYHTIEVKVDRPGLQLEYRKGYTSLDLDGPVLDTKKDHGKPVQPKDPFHIAMGYGAPAATQTVFAVRALPSSGPAKPGVIGSLNPDLKGKPLVRYSFAFDLPRDKITLAELPDGSRKASFELAIAAYDVQGRVLNSLDEKRSFVLKPEMVAGFLQKPFVVPMEIDLPPGALSVRAGVIDEPSQQMGVVEVPLSVVK